MNIFAMTSHAMLRRNRNSLCEMTSALSTRSTAVWFSCGARSRKSRLEMRSVDTVLVALLAVSREKRPSSVRAGNEPSRSLKFHNHGEGRY